MRFDIQQIIDNTGSIRMQFCRNATGHKEKFLLIKPRPIIYHRATYILAKSDNRPLLLLCVCDGKRRLSLLLLRMIYSFFFLSFSTLLFHFLIFCFLTLFLRGSKLERLETLNTTQLRMISVLIATFLGESDGGGGKIKLDAF